MTHPAHTSPNPVNLSFDVEKVREDFPILHQQVNGKPLVYFDNAATAQKPKPVIETISGYYNRYNSNIHRGIHYLSEYATQAYEESREKVRQHINAKHAHEIIFVRGATEGINLVASTFGRVNIQAGDEVIISAMEHHSNIVPWQMLCEEKGAHLKVAPINDDGELLLDEYAQLLTNKTKLVAMVYVSNTLGTINPIKQVIELAHQQGVSVLVDACQAVPHMAVDVQGLDCDFFAFSGHKLFGPTGTGVLYGKEQILDAMPPYHGGGEMIREVTFEKTTYNDLPYKFEAGTPHIAGGIGLGVAIDYVNTLGYDAIEAYEHELLQYATQAVEQLPKLRIIGTAANKASVISFVFDDIHASDIGTLVDKMGIAIRTGHHCTQPLMRRFGVPATARASFAFYNTKQEIDTFVDALKQARTFFE